MEKNQQSKSYYAVLNLKEKAPIQDVIKNYRSELKRTNNLDKQREICFAYCKICNERQEELFRYYFDIFLQGYQELIYDCKKFKYVIKKIRGEQ